MADLTGKPLLDAATPLCSIDQLQEGRFAFDTADGDTLLVIQAAGQVQVIEGLCPHQYFPLEFADLEDDSVLVCPLHGWRFDVTTGQSPDVAQICLRRWPAEVRDGKVYAANPRGT